MEGSFECGPGPLNSSDIRHIADGASRSRRVPMESRYICRASPWLVSLLITDKTVRDCGVDVARYSTLGLLDRAGCWNIKAGLFDERSRFLSRH